MYQLTPPQPDWPERFGRLAARLAPFLPSACVVHHVGSTAIPQLPAKDIIDLVIECPPGAMATVIAAVQATGYQHEGDLGLAGREAFRVATAELAASLPSHHLYACETGAYELRKHLAFRDYLRAHPERAQWLAAEKLRIAAASADRASYIEGKAGVYHALTDQAFRWRDSPV